MFTVRKTMQVLSVVGALVAAGSALAGDTSQDRAAAPQAAPQELQAKQAATACSCKQGDAAVPASAPAGDAEMDRLRAQRG